MISLISQEIECCNKCVEKRQVKPKPKPNTVSESASKLLSLLMQNLIQF